MLIDDFRNQLITWHDQKGRKHLPWQNDRSAYKVWVSEIMLQQTQVSTVIPYYLRFMERFPDVEALANSDVNVVFEYWAGLGYYARARNLHATASRIRDDHSGIFPRDPETLETLPGIGRSTAGAILSLGMNIRAPILDGNVKRVLCRYAGIQGWPGETKTLKELWLIVDSLTPTKNIQAFNQGMMDLGALVCVKHKPKCAVCPIAPGCIAFKQGLTDLLPKPKPKKTQPTRHIFMMILKNREGQIWLEKRSHKGIWGGLHSFPEFETIDSLNDWCASKCIIDPAVRILPTRKHRFSHYQLEYTAAVIQLSSSGFARSEEIGHWSWPSKALQVPTPIRSLIIDLESSP